MLWMPESLHGCRSQEEGDWTSLWNTKAGKDKDLIFGSESPWDVTRHWETLWGSIATCLHRNFLYSSLATCCWSCWRWDAWIEGPLSVPMLLARQCELRNDRGLVMSQWPEPSQLCATDVSCPGILIPFCGVHPVGLTLDLLGTS